MCAVLNNAPAVRDRVFSEISDQAKARGLNQAQQPAPMMASQSTATNAVSASSPARQKRTRLRGVSGLTIPNESIGVNMPQ